MKILKKVLKALLIAVIVLVIGFAGLILYAIITNYNPGEKTALEINDSPSVLDDSLTLSLLTWNIGYCGLDKSMDFFYDGGRKVFTPKEKSLENFSAVMSFLKGNDSIDFVLLQEIDKKSKRSYMINQFETLTNHVKYASGTFATNYQVFFVPVPPSTPMGKVYSGIATLGRYVPSSSVRYSFPGKYGFPKQLFMLDRCFMVNRYPVKNGKELVLINTHNEAYDPGEIRKAQMQYFKDFVLAEYQKGNYVVAGGDWNQCPPDFKPEFEKNKVRTEQMVIPSDYLPGEWKWIYDLKNPTNRSVDIPYDPSVTTTTVIDFFLVSPNIEPLSVNCINLDFEHSDHNPVRIKVRIK
jgi:endonuclease/exonuclease/phosphatase family metal-dependent hydrolase